LDEKRSKLKDFILPAFLIKNIICEIGFMQKFGLKSKAVPYNYLIF